MAARNVTPIPDMATSAKAFTVDLEKVLDGDTLERRGWAKPDDHTLLVPLFGFCAGRADFYLLKLRFTCYPEWPPSAQFVNPLTQEYLPAKDKLWVPNIQADSEFAVHPEYAFGQSSIQLICSSVTLEFYQVHHSVEDQHLWNAEKQNFHATIAAIRRAMRNLYVGPIEARP
jgi:hypothetical protein